jgi:hypothetical protein
MGGPQPLSEMTSLALTSRKVTVVFFKMDVVVRQQGGVCGDNGGNDGGGNIVMLAAIAGI